MIKYTVFTVVLLIGSICQAREFKPKFIEFLPRKQFNSTQEDIENHIDSTIRYEKYPLLTKLHEICHGINAEITTKRKIALNRHPLYVLENRLIVLTSPNTTITRVKTNIPSCVQGTGYSVYLVKYDKGWENQPLYILEEWIAFSNECAVAAEQGLPTEGSVYRLLEFNFYAVALLMTSPSAELTEFIGWNIERVRAILEKTGMDQVTMQHIDKVNYCSNSLPLRNFAKKTFGEDWCQTNLYIR